MSEAVLVGAVGMGASMAAIVVVGTLAGALLWWLEGKIDHGDEH